MNSEFTVEGSFRIFRLLFFACYEENINHSFYGI